MSAQPHAKTAPVALIRVHDQLFIDHGNGIIGAGFKAAQAFLAALRIDFGGIGDISRNLAWGNDP